MAWSSTACGLRQDHEPACKTNGNTVKIAYAGPSAGMLDLVCKLVEKRLPDTVDEIRLIDFACNTWILAVSQKTVVGDDRTNPNKGAMMFEALRKINERPEPFQFSLNRPNVTTSCSDVFSIWYILFSVHSILPSNPGSLPLRPFTGNSCYEQSIFNKTYFLFHRPVCIRPARVFRQ